MVAVGSGTPLGGRGAASAAHTLCRQQLLPPPRSATRPVQHTFPGPRREAGHLAQPEDARGGRRRPSPSGGLSRRFPAQVEDAAGGESVTGMCFLHRPGRREPAWSCLAAPPAVWESWLLWLGVASGGHGRAEATLVPEGEPAAGPPPLTACRTPCA